MRRFWLVAGLAMVLAAAGLVWALWPHRSVPPEPRARQYRDFTACLLTDERGVTGAEAIPVWAGLDEASVASSVRVQYLSVSGPQTVETALPFLASLAQGRCNLVFAAGGLPVDAVRQGAARFPSVRFVVVGGGGVAGNVSVVDPAGDVRAEVRRRVTIAAGG